MTQSSHIQSAHQPKMEVLHSKVCKGLPQHSKHLLLGHTAFLKPQGQHNKGCQPRQ